MTRKEEKYSKNISLLDGKIEIDFSDILEYLELNSTEKSYTFEVSLKNKGKGNEIVVKIGSLESILILEVGGKELEKSTIEVNINQNNLNIIDVLKNKIVLFPVIRYKTIFKGINKLPKYEYLFLYIYFLSEKNILIFSNNLERYLNKITKLCECNKQDCKECKISGLDENDFIKLAGNFYLFEINEHGLYKRKNILTFFPTLFKIIFGNFKYDVKEVKDFIYKIKGDSIIFSQVRFMQEKTIKTFLNKKEDITSMINYLFYGNLLKNLTFKIDESLLELNGKGKGLFNISHSKNSISYYKKVKKILDIITGNKNNDDLELPIFFLDKILYKETEFENYNIIDIFPRVVKYYNDKTYVIWSNSSKNGKALPEDLVLPSFLNNFDTYFKQFKKKYSYYLLEDNSIIDSSENNRYNDKEDKDNNKTKKTDKDVKSKYLTISDLFILMEEKKQKIIYLGKVKIGYVYRLKGKIYNNKKQCEEENNGECSKNYYMELYRLYSKLCNDSSIPDEHKLIFKKEVLKDTTLENKKFISILNDSFIINNKLKIIKGDNNLFEKDIKYFFSGASLKEEDKISLGLIKLLNNEGNIYIADKGKSGGGELADIIGIGEENDKLIIHLLHIKKDPFMTETPHKDGYGYYTTAIGQMLQKIEPILKSTDDIQDLINKFFGKKSKIKDFINDIKEDLIEKDLIKNILELNIEKEFIEKIKSSKKIELRVGLVICESQLGDDGNINNTTFCMINNLLINSFKYNIKPLIQGKEIDIVFCPIILDKKEKSKIKPKST